MTTFRSAQVATPGGEFAVVDRTLEDPGAGQVRVAVEACGVCHTDSEFVAGYQRMMDNQARFRVVLTTDR